MGIKDDKLTQDSVLSAEVLLEKLSSIEGITSKKMFGGHGIFHDGNMFGIIDSKGQGFMKADDSNRSEFENSGGSKHSKMSYYSISSEIIKDEKMLVAMAKKSIFISK